MKQKHVRAKVDRLAEILKGDDPSEAEQKEAVQIGLDLFAGLCTNIARIADSVEAGKSV